MSVLVNRDTKVLVCGMTGKEGTFHAGQMIEYGTNVVGGITPGKGGTTHLDRPVFDTAAEAVAKTGADAAIIFVPAPFAADSVLECEAAGIPFVTLITEGVPIQDMLHVVSKVRANGTTRLLGGNCAGIITPGECKMGIMPGHIFKAGPVGMVSRSGTLTYEVAWELTRADLGQTTCVGIGGDPVNGTSHLDVIKMFNDDPETHGIIMIGEIGGNAEVEAARWIKAHCQKPVAGFIAGATAPAGRRMGHAGAIVGGAEDTAAAKIAVFRECGIEVAATPSDMADALLRAAQAKGVNLS